VDFLIHALQDDVAILMVVKSGDFREQGAGI